MQIANGKGLLTALSYFFACVQEPHSCAHRKNKEGKTMDYSLCLDYLKFLFEMMIFIYLVSKGR